MKYLEEMEDKELVTVAKEERLFLGLIFNREKIIEKLVKKGYKRKNDEIVEVKEEKIEIIETIEEIDFLAESFYKYRSRSYYRNYPNKKMFRKFKKRLRFKNYKLKELFFNYRGINKEEIKKRETETEINKSKFSKGQSMRGNLK